MGRTSSVGFLWSDRTGQWIYFPAVLCASRWTHPTSHGCNSSSSPEELMWHSIWPPSSWHPSGSWACRSWMVGNPLPCLWSHESPSAELLLCSKCLFVCLSCCCLSHCFSCFPGRAAQGYKILPQVPHVGQSLGTARWSPPCLWWACTSTWCPNGELRLCFPSPHLG